MKTLRVDVWSDVICPWCWIGKRRFEKALAQFSGREQVEIVHHAFRLSPGQKPTPVVEHLTQVYHRSAEEVAAMQQQITQTAAQEGLDYQLEGTFSGDTLDAHRLLKLAADKGLAETIVECFYRANFSEHESLFDHNTLRRLSEDAGLERSEIEAVLQSDRYLKEVEDDITFLRDSGVSGVPFFIIDNRYGIAGAQSADVFLQALDQALAEGDAASADSAPTCGPEGCKQ